MKIFKFPIVIFTVFLIFTACNKEDNHILDYRIALSQNPEARAVFSEYIGVNLKIVENFSTVNKDLLRKISTNNYTKADVTKLFTQTKLSEDEYLSLMKDLNSRLKLLQENYGIHSFKEEDWLNVIEILRANNVLPDNYSIFTNINHLAAKEEEVSKNKNLQGVQSRALPCTGAYNNAVSAANAIYLSTSLGCGLAIPSVWGAGLCYAAATYIYYDAVDSAYDTWCNCIVSGYNRPCD